MGTRTCSGCKFFREPYSVGIQGVCRRYPAYVLKYDDEWCGEFSAKLKAVTLEDWNKMLRSKD